MSKSDRDITYSNTRAAGKKICQENGASSEIDSGSQEAISIGKPFHLIRNWRLLLHWRESRTSLLHIQLHQSCEREWGLVEGAVPKNFCNWETWNTG